jgi:hypothetical protein
VEDIRRSVNDILSRADHLEHYSDVEFFIPVSTSAFPDIFEKVKKEELREALELTAIHVAFAVAETSPDFFQMLLANRLIKDRINIKAKIDDIEPPYKGQTKIDEFGATILTESSVDSFLNAQSPRTLWQFAENEGEFELAIRLAAREIRRQSGCPDPSRNCEAFSLGASFVGSLDAWEATGAEKNSAVVLDTCARIVARMPKNELVKFFRPTGAKNKVEDVVRAHDSAEAWRTHVTKHQEALRLMFWRCRTGLVEFANVGAKDDLEIL